MRAYICAAMLALASTIGVASIVVTIWLAH
jgi:hypothetical protein